MTMLVHMIEGVTMTFALRDREVFYPLTIFDTIYGVAATAQYRSRSPEKRGRFFRLKSCFLSQCDNCSFYDLRRAP